MTTRSAQRPVSAATQQRDRAAHADLAAAAVLQLVKAHAPGYPADAASHDAVVRIVEAVAEALAAVYRDR